MADASVAASGFRSAEANFVVIVNVVIFDMSCKCVNVHNILFPAVS